MVFWAPCGSGGGWMGVVGGAPHTCAHAHACMHAHACVVNMIIPCKWLPPLDLGKSQGFPIMSYMCVHACAHVWGTLSPPPILIHPPPHPPGWGTPKISQNSIALELIEIFQFCLKIYDLLRHPHPCVGGWMGQWVGSGQMTNN